MLGREGRQLGGELGPAGRQAREHRAFLVEEVAGHGALEVRDGLVDALDVVVVGAARGEATRGFEQAGHHLVVTAVRSLELSEAGELHDPPRIRSARRRSHKRRGVVETTGTAC